MTLVSRAPRSRCGSWSSRVETRRRAAKRPEKPWTILKPGPMRPASRGEAFGSSMFATPWNDLMVTRVLKERIHDSLPDDPVRSRLL
jgi:hypothetical protein